MIRSTFNLVLLSSIMAWHRKPAPHLLPPNPNFFYSKIKFNSVIWFRSEEWPDV